MYHSVISSYSDGKRKKGRFCNPPCCTFTVTEGKTKTYENGIVPMSVTIPVLDKIKLRLLTLLDVVSKDLEACFDGCVIMRAEISAYVLDMKDTPIYDSGGDKELFTGLIAAYIHLSPHYRFSDYDIYQMFTDLERLI